MKKFLLVIVVLNGLFLSCKKNCEQDIPECIQLRIEQIKKLPKWSIPAEIHEYLYNGKTVYLISADCCDKYNQLVDKNCNNICSPGGGISGKGDGKCADFDEKSKHLKLVWKDGR